MSTLQLKSNSTSTDKLNQYPDAIKEKLLKLRILIIESATEIEQITELEETLKWGQLSYISKIGSTIRIDWSKKQPEKYAIYFQCSTKLVSTFRIVFKNEFNFENNRAIVFNIHDTAIPVHHLKTCIKTALCYHKVKHLPTLDL